MGNNIKAQLIMDDDHETPIINILNFDELHDQIKKAEENMKQSTFKTTDDDIRQENMTIRNSKISDIPIKMFINVLSDHITYVHDIFEYITYDIGGHFVEHVDYERELPDGKKSNCTFLIYPPQTVVGGELIIKDKLNNVYTIKPLSDEWIIVIFKCDLLHSSKPVTSG